MAKSRDKKHFKDHFKFDDEKYKNSVTMDQVTIKDFQGTTGIGGFKYALVLRKISKKYFRFFPLKSLDSTESTRVFREFCKTILKGDLTTIAELVVYSDAHKSLIKICDNLNLSRDHSPPGRPQANAVAERTVGDCLGGIRSYLTSGCLPDCFWPLAAQAYCLHRNATTEQDGKQPWERAAGQGRQLS